MKKVRNRIGKCRALLREKKSDKDHWGKLGSGSICFVKVSQEPFLASSKERDAGWIFIPVVPVAQLQNQMRALDKTPGFVCV